MTLISRLTAFGLLCLTFSPSSFAYYNNGNWTSTSQGPVGPVGSPMSISWSIVPDSTLLNGSGTPSAQSNFIATMDSWFGSGPGGSDLTQRPWFTLLDQSFDRWEALSGVTFVYQPNDDGVIHGSGTNLGNSLRGDIRLAGYNVDGTGGTYGLSWFVPNSDLTLDMGDMAHFTDATNNYRNFRNTLAHEIGHALGMGHFTSNANFLMEGAFSAAYDGPQFDDIRGIQYVYGDVYEKSNAGMGNDSVLTAIPLGNLSVGGALALGTHSDTGNVVAAAEFDFLSISNSSDVDFFSFTTTGPLSLSIALSPEGSTYTNKIGSNPTTTVTAIAISDLGLELYSVVEGVETLLRTVDLNPIGGDETLSGFGLLQGGEYFLKVFGDADDAQMYQFGITASAYEVTQPGDFDSDGDVDGRDFLIWQRGESLNPLSAENLADWQNNYGAAPPITAFNVPEPSANILISFVCAFASITRRKIII